MRGGAERVLVTGGAGFLGSHVASHLIANGFRVVVIDDFSGGFRRNVPDGAECHAISITDRGAIDALFSQHRFRFVYHLAAYAAEGLSHFVRHFNYSSNVLGSVNIINAAVKHDVECLVYTSSIAVYGEAPCPFDETTPCTPEDPYGAAKLAVEHDLRAARSVFGLDSIVFRPHNIYGERQNLADPYRNVVGIFMRQTLQGRPCTVFGDGSQTRSFTHVDDVAPVIATSPFVSQARGETFNLGADRRTTVSDLAESVQQVLGRRVGIEHLPRRVEVAHAHCDHAKVRRCFDLGAGLELERGLGRMASWALGLEIAPSRRVADLELDKNLPAVWAAGRRPGPIEVT